MKKTIRLKFTILLGIVAALLIVSFLAPYIVPGNPYETNIKMAKMAPSAQFPFGTDGYGRCVFSRILVGMKTSLFSTLLLVLVTFVFGTFIGVVSGYAGGKIDNIIMRVLDVVLAFPEMILAIAIAGLLGGGLINAMIALAATGWTQYARLARSYVITLKSNDFIHASRLSGNSNFRIMFRHLLPNILGPMVVAASLKIGNMMMGIAGLSFLGLGVRIPAAEWGSMISEGRSLLQTAPWIVFYTGLAMTFTIIVFNLLGDTVSDLLAPKRNK